MISNTDQEAEFLLADEEQLEALLEEAKEALAEEERKRMEMLDDIAQFITGLYDARKSKRGPKEQQWLKAEALRLDTLAAKDGMGTNPDRPFDHSSSSNRPGKNIVRTRCDIAISSLYASQFGGGEKNWDFLPPDEVVPDIPDIIERCEKMESTIARQLEESDFEKHVMLAMTSEVNLGTGVIKGPGNFSKMKKTYEPIMNEDGSRTWVPRILPERVPEHSSVNIWLLYPDDSVNDFNKSPDMIQVHPKSKKDLGELTKNPGFFEDVITDVLKTAPEEYVSGGFAAMASLSTASPTVFRNKYTVLEYHGPITRAQLERMEIEPTYEIPGDVYFGEVWVVNNRVIRMELANIEGDHRPPYYGDVWVPDPGSPFGFGIPILLADAARVAKQTWHMILDNASMSSAPQIIINQDMVDPSEGDYEIRPGKVWYHTDIGGDVNKVFQQFTIDNVTSSLFPILDRAMADADEESGVTLLAGGIQSPAVGTDSATNQAIISDNSTTLLDYKSTSWDKCVMAPCIRGSYDWNMQYNADDSIKAPMKVRVRAATDYRNKQMHIRDMEKISVESGQNPAMGEWINPDELVKLRLGMMSLPSRAIVKTDAQVMAEREERAANPPPPDPETIKAQAEIRRLDIEEQRLAIENRKVDMEYELNQKREEMEHRERLSNTYARVTEAEAQVVKSQNEKEMRMLELAIRSDTEAEREKWAAGIAIRNDDTKRLLGQLGHTAKLRDQLLTAQELKYAEKEGKGI